jgi:endonuclease YncB( thermonuclease family)
MHLIRPRVPSGRLLTAVLLASLAAAGCVESAQARRFSRGQAQASLESLETPGLVIGEFALAGKPVVDGDTIRVEGLDASLRLLAIDTEETIKDKRSARAVESDFERYLIEKRGDSSHPVKAGTPLGEAAKMFAVRFFDGVDKVRLERDDPREVRDRFDRYLAYVFVARGGVWLNYNVECVRAGMSPYFTKYSYSRRFHADFVAAEKEARAARRGIWAEGAQAYGDYDERKPWWDARAEFLKRFEEEAYGKPDHVVLTHWDAMARLDRMQGQEVTVLGLVSEVSYGQKGPSRVMLSRKMFGDLAVIFFDKDVFSASGVARYRGEFIKVTGVVSQYQNKHTKKRQLQLVVSLPSQVVGSEVPGLAPSTATAAGGGR